MQERRRSSTRSRASSASRSAAPARIRGAAGRTSASSTRRTTAATTSSCATSSGETTRFGLHVHVGIAGADRAIAVHDGLRNFLPELLALSASSPFVEAVNSGLHSARTEVFTRMFPRCGIPDAYGSWRGFEDYVAFLYRDRLDHRAHADLVERAPAPRLSRRSRSASATRSPTSRRRRRSRRSAMRSPPGCARAYDEGEPLPTLAEPPARGEPVARDPLRPVRRAARPRARRAGSRPRARLEQLVDGCSPSPTRSAVTPFLACPSRTPPSARSRGSRRARRLEEIFAEQVRAGEPVEG